MIRVALYFLSLFAGASFLLSTSFAQGIPATASQESLAIVSGQALYEKDLQPLIQGPLQQLQQQEYQIKRKALDELINQKLLEAEAKKQGLTPEKLLAQEVDAKVQEPTDSEVESYYLALKAQLNKPLQEVKPQIVQQLKQAKLQHPHEGKGTERSAPGRRELLTGKI